LGGEIADFIGRNNTSNHEIIVGQPLICKKRTNYLMLIAGNISSEQEAKEIEFISKLLTVKRLISRLISQKDQMHFVLLANPKI